MNERLLYELSSYIPFNEQEENDREQIVRLAGMFPDIFYRDNPTAHMTASAWVTDRSHTHILMAYHNIYNSWAWLGGHTDGDTNLLRVAMKEVREESGLQTVIPLTKDIFSIEILTVDGHVKKGKYVSSHLHLNVTYLLEADEQEILQNKEDENKAVGWFSPDEAVQRSTEPWFRERIYSKLNKKLDMFFTQNDRRHD